MGHAARRMALFGTQPQLPKSSEARSVSKLHHLPTIVLLAGVAIGVAGIGGFIANHWLHDPAFKTIALALTLAGVFVCGVGMIAVAATPRPTRALRKE